jgi:hypothetical protein
MAFSYSGKENRKWKKNCLLFKLQNLLLLPCGKVTTMLSLFSALGAALGADSVLRENVLFPARNVLWAGQIVALSISATNKTRTGN